MCERLYRSVRFTNLFIFKVFNVVELSCSLNQWKAGGGGVGLAAVVNREFNNCSLRS